VIIVIVLPFVWWSVTVIFPLMSNFVLNIFFQYKVIPTRRSTAEAFQILFSHALGDAGSSYLIGQVKREIII
jgi:hypothetical protein